MDVNQLLYNHQRVMLNAQNTLSCSDRDINTNLIGHYAAQIAAWRKTEGLPEIGWPKDERLCRLAIS